MPSFEVETMVRGYHVYQDSWDALVDEELACAQEPDNLRDPFAVAVVKSRQTVGHVPKKISSVCSLFLQHGGSITCKVTGRRRHSEDLPQGGLEISCTLAFEGGLKDVTKVEKLVTKFLERPVEMQDTPAEKNHLSGHVSEDEPSRKKRRPDDNHLDVETESILDGVKLTDLHVHFAQQLLKRQFPHLNGLQPTVLQAKKSPGAKKPLPNQLQVIHSRGDHWILASNIGSRNGDVSVYDSVYRSIDKETRAVITNLFQSSTLKLVESQKQEGGADWGIFAIATATALAHGIKPPSFNRSAMRRHLVHCFKEELMTLFPCS
jgi:hypothetical protein